MRQNVLVIDDQTSNAMLVAEILSGISPEIDVVTFVRPLEAVRYAAETRSTWSSPTSACPNSTASASSAS
jgi:CheY-like chemotaxis protein